MERDVLIRELADECSDVPRSAASSQATRVLAALERLGYSIVRATPVRTASYWVVNEQTGGIAFTVDGIEHDAYLRAHRWRQVMGAGHRVDRVVHEHLVTETVLVERETVVESGAADG